MNITKDKAVFIHYTLKNDNGDLIDTSSGKDPLGYIQGIGNIIAGLEKALEGKAVGDVVNAVIPPEEGYGARRDELIQVAPLSKFEDPENVKAGVNFHVQGPNGVSIAKVVKVENDDVTIDLNHPLADQTLHFEVEVVEIREATKEELDHGYIHGKGGVEH